MRRSIESDGAATIAGCRALLGLPTASSDPADAEARRRRVAYDGTWARAQRCVQAELARAAMVALRFKPGTPEHGEAVGRMRAVQDERDRLADLYRRGAPLAAPAWPPLGGAGVGSAPVDRPAAAPGLFEPPVTVVGPGGFDDILDAMSG